MNSSERRLLAGSRPIPRSELLAQAAAERVVELVISALDLNAILDQVDLNAVLDRIDLNYIVKRIDVEALVAQTDFGAIIASSSSSIASDVLDVARSQTVGLDEFIARWVARLRRRTYTGPPGPADPVSTAGPAGPAVPAGLADGQQALEEV